MVQYQRVHGLERLELADPRWEGWVELTKWPVDWHGASLWTAKSTLGVAYGSFCLSERSPNILGGEST